MAAARRQGGKIVAEPAVRISLADATARAAHGPRPACTASLKLCPAPGSARAARDFTATVLRVWDLTAALSDARLVVSELVTNALQHGLAAAGARAPVASPPAEPPIGPAEPPIGLRLLRRPGWLRCEVTDPSDIMPIHLVPSDDAEFGRGLFLIAALSHEWGATLLSAGGKCVWADLGLPS
jgi:hypothetical protein